MEKIFKRLMPVILTILVYGQVWSQERLGALHSNPVLKSRTAEIAANLRLTPLELPFFDDFYPVEVFPDQSKWVDRHVYVNAAYGVDPPTIGVATFDGLDELGDPYSPVSESSGNADQLTSRQINLSGLNNSDDVYLSFFYQPQGNGDAPEYIEGNASNQDLLLVEFQDTSGTWNTVWSAQGDTLHPFDQVFIQITDGYLYDTFQFRFQSVGRLTGAFDHWQVDYVRLDKNRDPVIEENIPEMAYQYLPTSLLSPYYSMPYNQYDSTYLADSHYVYIRNNFVQATTDLIDFYKAYDLGTMTTFADYSGPSVDIGPELSFSESYARFSLPDDLPGDTVVIRVDYSFLVSAEDTSNEVSIRNNRIVHDQVFNNYFSYDDGTAEQAYYLDVHSGDAQFGRAAIRYEARTEDTLQAVKVHLVNLDEDLTGIFFKLQIWKTLETDSTDAELLYEEPLINVEDLTTGDSIGSLNDFTYILIDSAYIVSGAEKLLVQGTFYVGYEVGINVILPIGWDINTDGSDAHFYNFGPGWFNTSKTGSLMINPVLGKPLPDNYVVSSVFENRPELAFDIFPNPVGQNLYFRSVVNSPDLEVLDIMGRKIMERKSVSGDYIDVSVLNTGAYFLRLTDRSTGISGTRQFIVK